MVERGDSGESEEASSRLEVKGQRESRGYGVSTLEVGEDDRDKSGSSV